MKVDGAVTGRGTPGGRAERPREGFADVLERARRSGRRGREGSGPASARADAPRASRPAPPGARAAGSPGSEAPAVARPADAAAGPRPGGDAPAPAEPRLSALVRALPPAIAAARAREGGAPLTLEFGSALTVDLRAVPAGVAVVIRPEARLAGAAEAELPRVIAALRARGVAVARAEVAARGGGRPAR